MILGIIIAFVIIGLIAAVVYLAMKNKSHEDALNERQAQEEDRRKEIEISSAHDITRAKKGDVAIFEGATEEYDDIQLVIDRINKYRAASGYEWHEVSGHSNGDRQHIEVHDDDDTYITLDLDVDLDLADLGIDEAFLARCDEEQSTSNVFDYDGKKWRYVESGETMYFKDGRGSGEGYWSWDFACEDDKNICLYIEKWEDEPFEVGMSRSLTPQSVKVYPV